MPAREFSHLRSLDGIRGIAVLMVVMIHSHLCSFGWVGCRFFVLSGFLITRILLAESEQPLRDYLRRFYWRRGLRIWPLYFGFLLLCAVTSLTVHIPETMPRAWPWLVTFSYNFARISPHFADSNYFGHFWTLCIEEQFYLMWPFVVFFLSRASLRRVVIFLLIGGPLLRLVSGFALSGVLDTPYQIQRGVHNLATSHLDAFAAGALLTILPLEWRNWITPRAGKIFLIILCITGVAGIAQSFVLRATGLPSQWLSVGYGGLEHFHQYVWAYSLLNFTSAALILCALEDTPLRRWLAQPWLAYIGKISFGVYVLHLPLMYISLQLWPGHYHSPSGLIRFITYFAITISLASASYFFFEKRFLMLKDVGWGNPRKSRTSSAKFGDAPESLSNEDQLAEHKGK